MKNFTLGFIGMLLFIVSISSKTPFDHLYQISTAPVQNIFFQVNNIHTVFRTDGYFNYDKITFPGGNAGLIWPASSSTMLTADFATGIWVGAKVGPQRELRLSASLYNTHYSPGNIPVIGQVPSSSVCNDPTFRGYLENLVDQSLVNGGTRTKIAGGRTYTFTYDAWADWPVQKGAPYVEVNNVPGYQPGWNSDRPGIGHTTARPDEISFMVFMDYTNCTNNVHLSELSLPGGTPPLGVEIQQLSFAFNLPGYQDMIFMKWKIFNKSSLVWDSTYISIIDDGDLGYASDDAVGCDSAKQLGFTYNFDNDDEGYYGPNPPALGYRFLESPINYTGNNSDTAHLPYGNFTGFRLLRMSGYNYFRNSNDPCMGDPDNAQFAYNFMRGKDGCGNTLINWVYNYPTTYKFSGSLCPRSGWYDSVQGDTRHVLSTGPFKINSGEERILLAVVMVARGSDNLNSVCQLRTLSDNAMQYYLNSFGGSPIGITQTSTEVPGKFTLYQNYPNPFNPSTKIKFSVPKSANITIIIYDNLGRELTTLLNEQLSAGTYDAEFDGTKYASGVYYYKLITNDYTDAKKMLIIK
jgi:hypothetical protein